MAESSVFTRELPQLPIVGFGPLDHVPHAVLRADDVDERALLEHLSPAQGRDATMSAAALGAVRSQLPIRFAGTDLPGATRERLVRTVIGTRDSRLAVLEVAPVGGRVMSDRPFALRVRFAAARLLPPRLAAVRVQWAGDPFDNEVLLTADDAAAGYVDVHFSHDQTLPTGAAEFDVTLYNEQGSAARYMVTCAVLPSNPFALSLGPNAAFVTGTWSARGVRNGDAYDTGVAMTLSNGDAGNVTVSPTFHWAFWDGGVGGSLVEQGDGSFGDTITVPAFNTWRGWVAFHSPNGSGIFNKYAAREDMTIELKMTRADGRGFSGTITARTMFRFGVNITAVAGEDFTNREWADLDAAAARTRTIYERRDLTFDTDDRLIPKANVGGYEIIDSYSEFHSLLADWSGPNTNQNIDAFVVQAIQVGGGVDGIDGSIPGPTSHAGGDSGVIASKGGYVDVDGTHRLDAAYLGMLIGHELGHYLGLQHTSEAGNLLLPSSGTNDINLNYDQYRTMVRHGWVRID
jgi:hypothetical protein